MAVIFVSTGIGLSGGPIVSSGTINLLPPVASNIGGVKAGANITIAPDGTISAPSPGIGTLTGVTPGPGLTGGGTTGNVTLGMTPATVTTIGGVSVGDGLIIVGANLRTKPATLGERGSVFLASSSEVIIGTDVEKAVTPATLVARTATTSRSGLVQLENSTSSTSVATAATPNSVKVAFDTAVSASTLASGALSRSGGVMTGPIIFSAGQTFPGVAFPVATANSLGVVSVGPGLSVNSSGVLSTSNVGTVTAVTAGAGLGSPATGNVITTSGTLQLLPPTGTSLGGVKAGANISIAFDGTISVPGSNFIASNNPYAFNSYIFPAPLASPALPFPGVNGQVLTVLDNVLGTVGWTSAGTLQSVTAGTGITVVSTPTTATVSLTTVPSITPGNYGGTSLIPTLAINQFGQVVGTGLANPFTPFQTPTITAPFILVLDFTTNDTNWDWVLQGNTNISNPLNAVPGQTGHLLISQNALVTYGLTWGTSWKFANFTPYAGNTTLAAVDLIEFTVVAANYIVVTNVVENIG